MVSDVDPRACVLKKVARFAAAEVAPEAELFSTGGEFPLSVWRRMGAEGLLGLNLPESVGGMGCDVASTLAALETFTRHGRCLGLAFSWLIHLIVSRHFILGFGSPSQCARYLPQLAAGNMTASVAISEPGVGAHPKHLKTSAHSDGNGRFVLNGEKSFLTNGPIADCFIIFAVTSVGAPTDRKGFSAFLVKRDTPGLSLSPPFDLGCFYPSPHCALTLRNCRVPAASILGKKDIAYEQMARPFRSVEDLYLAALALGGMELQLDLLLEHIRSEDRTRGDGTAEGLGRLRVLLDSFQVIFHQIAGLGHIRGADNPLLLSRLLAFRQLLQHYQACFEDLRGGLGGAENSFLGVVTRDLRRLGGIAKNIVSLQLKKIGESLLSGKESNAGPPP